MKTQTPEKEKRKPDDHRPERPPKHGARTEDPFAVDREPHGRGPTDRRSDTSTRSKLLIPYYPKDVGDRTKPFPPGVISWLCEGIQILKPDGNPHLGKLDRGVTYKVRVDVSNAGSRLASAEVAVYWADPSAGFGPPHLRRKPELGPTRTLLSAPGTTDRTTTINLTPTATTPDHICLLAVVSAFDDSPSGSWNPLADRHYAQHNVDIVHIDQGGIGTFWFFATNPLPEAATLTIRIHPTSAEELHTLSRRFGADWRELRSGAVGVALSDRGRLERADSELEIELGAGERRLCQGLVSAEGLRRGEVSAVTVEMIATPARGASETVGRGSFGAIVFTD
ncbi:MAG: hypothetical protein E5Y63_21920 [Mesorhizobium sp.]|uniref:hypothetical protein n=1 Tax=Mesorhizobium sp. TaxID=1871066 RepID=UPI00120FDC1E|nr:hypothetical protein [Mesorhizobium sp.]TIM28065.1 MAG: hypothetical protein E5Y63_21920 [Mesorhizobium sp.]